jgi:hypothetical protein
VLYDKELVKNAPRVDADEELTPPGGGTAPRITRSAAASRRRRGRPLHLRIDRRRRDDPQRRPAERRHRAGRDRRARLRKRVITETQTATVSVSHDQATVEREPIADGNVGQAMDGPAMSEDEHEVVLTAQTPVVGKEAVPVERAGWARSPSPMRSRSRFARSRSSLTTSRGNRSGAIARRGGGSLHPAICVVFCAAVTVLATRTVHRRSPAHRRGHRGLPPLGPARRA